MCVSFWGCFTEIQWIQRIWGYEWLKEEKKSRLQIKGKDIRRAEKEIEALRKEWINGIFVTSTNRSGSFLGGNELG